MVTIALDADEPVTISNESVFVDGVAGQGTLNVTDNGDADASTWNLEYTIDAADAGNGDVTFSFDATDSQNNTATFTDADLTSGNVTVDQVIAAPTASATDGFTLVAGDVDSGGASDTVDVVVGSNSPGLSEDIGLYYAVSSTSPNDSTPELAGNTVGTAATPNGVVIEEIEVGQTNNVYVRAKDRVGNVSAWTNLGGDQ
ncbi:hypothetical protein [Salimicrobium halophilum]|uniref:Uncharacterized protein n=1 Tax=Salimicrobium halophilum TaxID=86666 RepID=A0A1G8SEI5_9BACI|nr:hypothetical protein [Salimicrobium halophilum]SDJ27584.1 hypothetical protein SAMN04490247_1414 [Salimicrobium halophilum]